MSDRVPDWVTLTDGEEVVWTGGPTLLAAAGPIVGGALLVLAGLAGAGALTEPLRWLALAVAAVGLVVVAATYVRVQSTRYVLTSEEVYRKTGILSRRVTNLRLERIQDTSFSQSLLQRIFSYGDVHISTAGSTGAELRIEDVSDPQHVSAVITRQLDALSERR